MVIGMLDQVEAGLPPQDLALATWRIRSAWRISWDAEGEGWRVFQCGVDRRSGKRSSDRGEALRYYLAEANLDGAELARWACTVAGASPAAVFGSAASEL
jgi:hypothetical protein